jgi:hypothetical protein
MPRSFPVNARLRRVALLLLPPLVVDAIRSIRRWTYRAEPAASAVIAAPASVAGPASCSAVRKYWGLGDLDHQIEKYLDFDCGYYVELGANDGRLSSNTLYYEQFRNWRGVLIEPAPNLYLECRKNRSAQNQIVCAACVAFDYKGDFVKIIYSNSMSVALNVETDVMEWLMPNWDGSFCSPGRRCFPSALLRVLLVRFCSKRVRHMSSIFFRSTWRARS